MGECNTWISLKKEVPDYGEPVLFLYESGFAFSGFIYDETIEFFLSRHNNIVSGNVTHFMRVEVPKDE